VFAYNLAIMGQNLGETYIDLRPFVTCENVRARMGLDHEIRTFNLWPLVVRPLVIAAGDEKTEHLPPVESVLGEAAVPAAFPDRDYGLASQMRTQMFMDILAFIALVEHHPEYIHPCKVLGVLWDERAIMLLEGGYACGNDDMIGDVRCQ